MAASGCAAHTGAQRPQSAAPCAERRARSARRRSGSLQAPGAQRPRHRRRARSARRRQLACWRSQHTLALGGLCLLANSHKKGSPALWPWPSIFESLAGCSGEACAALTIHIWRQRTSWHEENVLQERRRTCTSRWSAGDGGLPAKGSGGELQLAATHTCSALEALRRPSVFLSRSHWSAAPVVAVHDAIGSSPRDAARVTRSRPVRSCWPLSSTPSRWRSLAVPPSRMAVRTVDLGCLRPAWLAACRPPVAAA